MSTGRPCVICSDAQKTKIVASMIAEGATDAAIAARLGGNLHRTAVSRHRRNHVEAPARAIVAAAAKGRDVVEQRAQVLAAAETGDPAAFVALGAIVADLRNVHERLERTASAAEQDNQRVAVASLAGQQIRVAETRARLGGIGGYAPQRGGDGGEQAAFSLTIQFSGDRSERIDMFSTGRTIDAAAERAANTAAGSGVRPAFAFADALRNMRGTQPVVEIPDLSEAAAPAAGDDEFDEDV